MSREIEFRAWHEKTKRYYYSDDEAYVLKFDNGRLGLYEDVNFYNGSETEYVLISNELEQFTGLRDKNGVKIFEGDIIRHTDMYGTMTAKVIFSTGEFRFYWITNGLFLNKDLSGSVKVIGNIHQNADLLEVQG